MGTDRLLRCPLFTWLAAAVPACRSLLPPPRSTAPSCTSATCTGGPLTRQWRRQQQHLGPWWAAGSLRRGPVASRRAQQWWSLWNQRPPNAAKQSCTGRWAGQVEFIRRPVCCLASCVYGWLLGTGLEGGLLQAWLVCDVTARGCIVYLCLLLNGFSRPAPRVLLRHRRGVALTLTACLTETPPLSWCVVLVC